MVTYEIYFKGDRSGRAGWGEIDLPDGSDHLSTDEFLAALGETAKDKYGESIEILGSSIKPPK